MSRANKTSTEAIKVRAPAPKTITIGLASSVNDGLYQNVIPTSEMRAVTKTMNVVTAKNFRFTEY